MATHPTPTPAPPPPPPDVKVPRGVSPGTIAHSLLCHLVDSPTEHLEAIAKELSVTRAEVYAAMIKLKYHGLVVGTYSDREVTPRGLDVVRATVKRVRV